MLSSPLFPEPFGPSEIREGDWGWNVVEGGTHLGDETCGLCGTHHPKGVSVIYGKLLNVSYVEQCCGGIADYLYRQFGRAFFAQLLREIGADPVEHADLLREIRDALAAAAGRLDGAKALVTDCQGSADRLPE